MKSRTKRFVYLLLLVTCVFSILCESSFAQESRTITGIIKGQNDNAPISGVSVYVKGKAAIGTTTDALGHFSLKVPAATETLIVSSVGIKDKEVSVRGTSNVEVTLSTAAQSMNEVVVVGYGTQKKSLVTGAITSIKGNDLVQAGVMRADDALQGKAAGVVVTANSGQPGTAMSIRIRGVGTNGTAQPLYIVDGMAVGDIEYLSATDIESMEVMKDAASAAIYGARGANGVIIITTKKGSEGKTSVQYNGYYGWQNIARKVPVLDAHQYTVIQNEAAFNGGQSLPFTSEDLDYYSKYKGTDWQEAVLYRNAPVTQQQISFRGGDKTSSYNMSASYFGQDGILAKDKSKFERYTFSINSDKKFFQGALTIGENLILTRMQKQAITQNSLTAGPLVSAINMDPLTPVYDTTLAPKYHGYAVSQYVAQEIVNPVARIALSYGKNYYTKLTGGTYMELKFLKDFRFKTTIGAEVSWNGSSGYTPIYQLNSSTGTTANGASMAMDENRMISWENVLTWSRKFNNVHDVTAMAGTTYMNGSDLFISGNRNDLIIDDPNYAYLSMATNTQPGVSGGLQSPYALYSNFGRINYAYDNRFLFTATIRRDGSSRFGPSHKFGVFPSASVGWNVTNEKFMQNINWIDNLKIRGSWGQNGNDRIPDFAYMSLISTYGLGYVFGSQVPTNSIATGAAPTKTPTPDLKWEASEQLNFGFDVAFLKNFTATFDWYSKTTKDLLIGSVPIPLMAGNTFPTMNAGTVTNKGVEFALAYKKKIHAVTLDVNANIAYNKNEVTAVNNLTGFVSGASLQGLGGDITRMQVGHPMAYFWGFKTLGIFQNQDDINAYVYNDGKGNKNLIQPSAKPGDFKFQDTNGDGKIDNNDRVDLGNPNPKLLGGFNLNLGYKNFDLGVNTSWTYGNKIFSVYHRLDLIKSNYPNWVLNRWHGEGTSNSVPAVTYNDANKSWGNPSDFYVKDGSYFRVRNVTLGYTYRHPSQYFQSARLYFSVTNLFTFTKYGGYDPEIGGSPLTTGVDAGVYPHPRTVTVGCNITL
jgi:TonB-linked SusC/RagA family outer membrane protein